ncbi:hypothetical protein [Atlantibacter hermannii]|uniref:hypothetical protein n=1 Tax=Atlantibacter hermannii TaxID=565 RepID=UPI00289D08C2|nr:hypothetical protein [Atlantibacter hermannii]
MLIKFLINICVAIVLTYILAHNIPIMPHGDILTAAGVISTVSGILFGFVLATISIFSSASGNSDGIIKALKNNNILPGMITRLLVTGATLIAACILSLLSMFVSEHVVIRGVKIEFILIVGGLALLVISIASFIFTWRKINWILPHI